MEAYYDAMDRFFAGVYQEITLFAMIIILPAIQHNLVNLYYLKKYTFMKAIVLRLIGFIIIFFLSNVSLSEDVLAGCYVTKTCSNGNKINCSGTYYCVAWSNHITCDDTLINC